MQMKVGRVGRRPQMCGAMYQYYKNTKNNILTQTSSDTLTDALSETMKKLSIRAKKQFKRKMERPRAASYSVAISRHEEREKDEDEYSIIGIEEYEPTDEKEVNNNEIILDLQEYDSFAILRSKSMKDKTRDWDEESYIGFVEGMIQTPEKSFPTQCSSPCPPEEPAPRQEEETPDTSVPSYLDTALQAFSQSTATDRDKLKSKLPDPEDVSVHVRDKFSQERRSMITLPIVPLNLIKQRPKTAPDNSDLEREWRKMMLKNRGAKRQMSL